MGSKLPERLCGIPFSQEDLDVVRQEAQAAFHHSRAEIARRVCRRLNWMNSLGQAKLMSCRVALLRLHRAGLIELPLPQKGNGNGRGLTKQKVKLPRMEPLDKPVGELQGLCCQQVSTREESAYWNSLIDEYHYLGYTPLSGAQVRYLIRWDGGDLGAIGFSASAWKVGVRDRWVGWDEATRRAHLHLVVNNARFLILPNVASRNLASRVLSMSVRQLRDDFHQRYGYKPVLMETFVEKARFSGTCYRAANWTYLGDTKGRGKLDRHHEHLLPVKSVFVYPLVGNFRQQLQEVGQ